MTTLERAKNALWLRKEGVVDGYVAWPVDNLLPGIRMDQFEADLRQGDGNELRMKFCAVHSSSALAVNSFAIFKDRPSDLELLGSVGAFKVEFERKLEVLRGSREANVDVWVERTEDVVAVESKCLEYLTPKLAKFSTRYNSAISRMEPPWQEIFHEAKAGPPQYLDRAQLIKHYLGLRNYQVQHPSRQVVLLYVFWEPMNAGSIEECRAHDAEIEAFAGRVSASSIRFEWQTYSRLWDDWAKSPALAAHARNLRNRYEVNL